MTDEKITPAAPAASAPLELEGLGATAAKLDEQHAPPGAAKPAGDQLVDLPPTHEIVEMLLTPAFALLAPNWKVTPAEIEQLSLAYGAVVDKYFPDLRAGPEIAALLITGAVLTPRIMMKMPRKLDAKKSDKPAPKPVRDDQPVDVPEG